MKFVEYMNEVKILASGRAVLALTDTTALPTIFIGATKARLFEKTVVYPEPLC